MTERDGPGAPAGRGCQHVSKDCDGVVEWQVDGAVRCARHQLQYERRRRSRRMGTAAVAAAVIVLVGFVLNVLIREEEGPSQARAWEVCEEHAVANLDLPAGASFAELPINPSERVKIQLGSNRYDVWSRYETPDGTERRFHCIVAYRGSDDWEVLRFDVEPSE